jgi:hypothetical protein
MGDMMLTSVKFIFFKMEKLKFFIFPHELFFYNLVIME